MRRGLVTLALLPFLVGFDLLESPNRAVEDGNARMKAGKAEDALGHYDKAAKGLPGEPGVHFDRGAALFALSRFDEAAQEFLGATMARAPALKESAFYNLGNALFKKDQFDEAIAAYRRALVLDPGDVKAKWNLELALKRKKDQDEKNKQKNDKKDQSKKDDGGKNKDDKKDQDKGDKKNDQAKQDKPDKPDKQDKKDDPARNDQKQQGKDDQQDKQDQASSGKDQKKPQDPDQNQGAEGTPPPGDKPQDMKEIEAVLDSLERSPRDLEQERARLRAIRRAPPTKDW